MVMERRVSRAEIFIGFQRRREKRASVAEVAYP